MKQFKPYGNFKLEDYYGVSMMKRKRDNKYSIRLIYDYVGGNSRCSNAITVASLEETIAFYYLLDKHSNNKSEVPKEISLEQLLNSNEYIETIWG